MLRFAFLAICLLVPVATQASLPNTVFFEPDPPVSELEPRSLSGVPLGWAAFHAGRLASSQDKLCESLRGLSIDPAELEQLSLVLGQPICLET